MATFSELIRLREGILMRLVPISERQREIVESGDVSLLMELLGRKFKVFEEFERTEQQLAPFKDIPPEERIWDSEEERLRTAKSIEHSKELIAEILRNDERSTGLMAQQKDELAEQIRRMDQGNRMQVGYAKQSPSGNVRRFNTET